MPSRWMAAESCDFRLRTSISRAARLVVEAVGHRIFGDIGVDQEDLAVLRLGIGFRDGGLAGAQRLHLRAHQHDARFERGLDGIGVARLAVVGDDAWCRRLSSWPFRL